MENNRENLRFSQVLNRTLRYGTKFILIGICIKCGEEKMLNILRFCEDCWEIKHGNK